MGCQDWALYSLGITKDSVVRYETIIRSGKFVVLAHGKEKTSTVPEM